MTTKSCKKVAPNFECKSCDYVTCKKSSFNNHSLSTKHIKSIKVNALETFGNEIKQKICSTKYTCEKCSKEFKNRSGLWKHKQKCVEKIEQPEEIKLNEPSDKDLIMGCMCKVLLYNNLEKFYYII